MLALDRVSAYYGDSLVLQEVSFSLGKGRLLGLLGRNGAGKSTAYNLITGRYELSSGKVFLKGEDITNKTGIAIFWRISSTFCQIDRPAEY